ncbi:MAG: hypothetical protein CVT92_05220 [Bacteroidetes bacterium HGW-Bacteroidetes-1]|jgi:chemotaxis protein methyltransferase CheR|nr:MAG: hypothetical protein CVT92_05220 [Bacteroidetes bacterium HGW-Bacteroidetes-1]
MTKVIQLEAISQRITHLFGLEFGAKQYESLERYLLNAANELKKSTSLDAIDEWLCQTEISEEEMKVLANCLTIGETYFFREKVALDLFTKKIIPELIEQRKGTNQFIRIWSAGCSSGEEPYTLAILLKEMIPDIQNWNISILATDINSDALKKAKSGIYTAWSFRETPVDIKKKYFSENGRNFMISPEIKKMVHFSQLNLSNDIYPSLSNHTQGIDVIFCRNVLMYFMPEAAKQVSKRFHMSLNTNGWLITSQVELIDDYFSLFDRMLFGQGIFYRKALNAGHPINHIYNLNPVQDKESESKSTLNEKLHNTTKEPRTPISHQKSQLKRTEPLKVENALVQISFINVSRLFDEAKYAECVEVCLNLLSVRKDDFAVILMLTKAYANLGLLDDARNWAEHLIKNNGSETEILYIYATILMEQKEWEMAEKNLIKILYMKPDHLEAQLYLGNTLKKLGKNQLASKYFQNLINHLETLNADEIVPGFEGMTAETIRQMAEIYRGS